jgi:hypothetical protein
MPYKNSEEHKRRKNEWYEKNKSLTAQRAKESRQRKRIWFNTIMDEKSCERCGESDNACLDWHHVDPSQKEHEVSFLLCNRSREAILEEIDKCICLCSNCHRKLHYYGM